LLPADLICLDAGYRRAPRGIGPYLRQHLFDKTFQGLYQTDAFDRALLVRIHCAGLLAGYEDRYILVYLYYSTRKPHH